ncbi:MAG: ATP-binding protein [Hyphomicrobiaceae bacterium]
MPLNQLTEKLTSIARLGVDGERLEAPDDPGLAAFVNAVNQLLDRRETENRDLKARIEEEVRAREDHQTTTALLRQTQNILRHRTDKLKAALKETAASNEAKSSFLANVSHELRTPMNGIIGMSELLLRSDLNDRQKQLAKTIVDSGRALVVIINDILDFSKIAAGKIDLRPIDFDFRACVNDVIALLSVQASSKNIELRTSFNCDMPSYVVGDAGRIRQVLTNLIGNAVKFTEKGLVEVRVHFEELGPELGVQFEVIDTGPGIPPGSIERIFEKFNQVDNTSSRQHEGTGLGLAICRQLIEAMEGEIGVESELGKGARFFFRFRLPRAEAPVPFDSSDFQLSGKSIHIVENEISDTKALTEYLKNVGALTTCWSMHNWTDAVAEADAVVVFCQDVQSDGAQMIKKLRDTCRGFGAPIVVAASVGVIGDGAILEKLGTSGFIPCNTTTKQKFEIIRKSLFVHGVGNQTLVNQHSIDQTTESDASCASANPQTTKYQEPAHQPDPTSFHVLVVDDSLVNQMVASEFLAEMGCRISIATNGKEAVELTAKQSFDMVFMDCQMPIMDGYDATKLIRERERQANAQRLPIVALTANAFDSDRDKCLDVGMDEFITKPLVPEHLEEMINRFVPGRASAA